MVWKIRNEFADYPVGYSCNRCTINRICVYITAGMAYASLVSKRVQIIETTRNYDSQGFIADSLWHLREALALTSENSVFAGRKA